MNAKKYLEDKGLQLDSYMKAAFEAMLEEYSDLKLNEQKVVNSVVPADLKNKLNDIASVIHSDNVKKGFYQEKREIGTLLMLITSELAEALEADRKGRYARIEDFNNENSKNNFDLAFCVHVKNSFEDEIADTIIRCLDLVGYLKIDIDFHISQKLKYNRTRTHKHGKAY